MKILLGGIVIVAWELELNCVLGQDTEIGILKRHIMHVSHKPYESVSRNMLWTEIMWGRAWLLTL